MALGPGKYDDLATFVREKVKARGALVLVIEGDKGSGFSVQGDLELSMLLPDVLEDMAAQIRGSLPAIAPR